jgi:hypothetical protein
VFQSVDGDLTILLVGSDNQPGVGLEPWNFAGEVAPVLVGVDGGLAWEDRSWDDLSSEAEGGKVGR